MRRWIAGERVVPEHVIRRLPDVLGAEAQKRRSDAQEFEVIGSEIMAWLMEPLHGEKA